MYVKVWVKVERGCKISEILTEYNKIKMSVYTYATNWNGLNNFDRGPPRDHSCEVWSKSNEWFQRRCCLKKLLTHARTHGRWTTDNGPSQKLTLSTLCSGELKMLLFECNITVNSFVSGHRQLRVKSPPPNAYCFFWPSVLCTF